MSERDILHGAVRALVNRYDPAGLLAAGFPEDEYEPEVRDLVELVQSEASIDEGATNQVWQK